MDTGLRIKSCKMTMTNHTTKEKRLVDAFALFANDKLVMRVGASHIEYLDNIKKVLDTHIMYVVHNYNRRR